MAKVGQWNYSVCSKWRKWVNGIIPFAQNGQSVSKKFSHYDSVPDDFAEDLKLLLTGNQLWIAMEGNEKPWAAYEFDLNTVVK